jgi:predicted DNA binding CopG/RHH family protein
MQLDKCVNLRLTSKDEDRLKKLATDKRVKLSSYIRIVLGEHLNDTFHNLPL